MKRQSQIIFLISFAILNLFAFQNCALQNDGLEVKQEASTLLSSNQKNTFRIPQDSEAQEFTIESLYADDKSQLVKYLFSTSDFPLKTKHGFITKLDARFGVFSYEPDKGFFGEDSIEYSEESLVPKLGTPTRVDDSREEPVTISIYSLKLKMIVLPPMILKLGTTGVLNETPEIILKNPLLKDIESANLKFEAQVVAVIDGKEEGKALTKWIKIKNKEKIKGLNLEGSTSYFIKVRNVDLPGYEEEVYSAMWTTTDSFFNLVLGEVPDSLNHTPSIQIYSITRPSEDDEMTFDAQISYILNNEKKIVQDANGSDWFADIKNGSVIGNINLHSKTNFTIEVRNMKSILKPINNPKASWTTNFTALVTPTNLEVRTLESKGLKALTESPLLSWGPPEVVKKIMMSKNSKFELSIYNVTHSKEMLIYQGTPTLTSEGGAIVSSKFEDGNSYAFKVRIVSVDQAGNVVKAETSDSVLSTVWKVSFEINCQLEINPPIGVNCADGSIFLGYSQNRQIRIYTIPNNGQYPTSLNYQDASQACEDLNSDAKYGKVKGWRLPTDTEALSLMFYKKQKTYDISFKGDDGYYTQTSHYYPQDKLSNFAANDVYYNNKRLSFPDLGFGVGYEGAGFLWTSKMLNGSNGFKMVDYYRTINPTNGGFGTSRNGEASMLNPYFCVRTE